MAEQLSQIENIDSIDAHLDYQAIVIGAGVAGIYQIKRLADLGVRATVLDGNPDLGGTWYNNRYPGARFDSESYTYSYSFSKEVLDEWHWTEKFSPQPETLQYLNFVTDKFQLRQYMQFNCWVEAMVFDKDANFWTVKLADGRQLTTRFIVTGVGVLSTPTLPKLEGLESFKGVSFHAANWPHEPLDLTGKRVAVVGTGATAIQLIPEVAKVAKKLTVFQRRANWAAPLNNGPISEADMEEIRQRYDEIFEVCARSPGGFEHEPDRRGFYEVSPEQRKELWDRLYDEPGFGIWLQNFMEIFVDEKANAEFSGYIADRIRARVDDPVLAEILIPKDHGFGIQRVPLETGYYETYNRDNVTLVDLRRGGIERITDSGVDTGQGSYEFDVLVYATGFDAMTGALGKIDIRGRQGHRLTDYWEAGPRSYLGLQVAGFPNLFTVTGPGSPSVLSNMIVSIEQHIDWISRCIADLDSQGVQTIEATVDAEDQWIAHVNDVAKDTMLPAQSCNSWYLGANIPGKPRIFMPYVGGVGVYREKCDEVAEKNYEGLLLQA